MKLRVCILLLLFLSPIVSSGEVLVVSEPAKANKVIEQYLDVLVDEANDLTLEDLVKESFTNNFISFEEFSGLTDSRNTYWLRLVLENKKPYAPLGLDLSNFNHLIDVYFLGDLPYPVQLTGFFRSNGENDEIIPMTNIIRIPEAEQIEIYLRIRNITDEKPHLELSIVNIPDEVKRTLRNKTFDAFLLGMMMIMMLYGLFLYYHHREKFYLFYSLYIFFLIIWYITCFEFGYAVFNFIPRKIYPYSDVPVWIGFLFYIQFIKTFLETPVSLPGWNRILTWVQVVLVFLFLTIPVFMLVSNRIFVGYMVGAYVAFFLVIVFSILIIKLLRSGIRFSNIIAIGSSFLMLGLFAALLFYILFTDYSLIFQKLGTILELTVFTFGISLRYKAEKEEKELYQQKAIDQLEENTRIQEQAKKELEGKVKERTIEIEEKNHILTDQNEEIKAQRDMLFQQNSSIQESIRYASRIQSAILPSSESVQQFLPKHFILFKPRDIVSGDFYWLGYKEDKAIIAVVDCTGHGVPGAFMSMLGSSLIQEIVNTSGQLNANEVLDDLRDRVIMSLRQTGKPGEAKDGMDMSICILDTKRRKLQFAGANSSLFHISKGTLTELKGDRMPIGISSSAGKSFQKQDLKLSRGDTIYMSTDGFPDQFGGPKGKKFLKARFKDLLLSFQDKIMHEQMELMDRALFDWMNPMDEEQKVFEQVDDILIIGIRV